MLLSASLIGFASMLQIHPELVADHPAARRAAVAPGGEQRDWANYGNDAGSNRFAALDQINVGNVGRLKVAWTFRTGDPVSNGSGAEDQLRPLQIGDKLFVCTPRNNVTSATIAANRARGRMVFDREGLSYDPRTVGGGPGGMVKSERMAGGGLGRLI